MSELMTEKEVAREDKFLENLSLYTLIYDHDIISKGMANTITAMSFRKQFRNTLDKIANSDNPIIITRWNKPMVIVYPYKKIKDSLLNPKLALAKL